MIKKCLALAIFLIILCASPAYASAVNTASFTIGSTSYFINGQAHSMDVAPYIQNNRAFVPLRYAAQALGVTPDHILYNSGKIVLIKGDKTIRLTIGNNILSINGNPIYMDVNAVIVKGRTMLPIRWIGLALGVDISWNQGLRQVVITDGGEAENSTAGNNSDVYSNPLTQASLTGSNYVVPPIAYKSSVPIDSKNFSWKYNGINYSWHVEIPDKLLAWDKTVYNLMDQYYNECATGYDQQRLLASIGNQEIVQMIESISSDNGGNYVPIVNETLNSEYISSLAKDLQSVAKNQGFDSYETADFILSFVGGAIPYNLTDLPELPGQTLFDTGDCKDKSILLACMLKDIGYKVALLAFDPPSPSSYGHMAVGIAFSTDNLPQNGSGLSYYPVGNRNYYFAETTAPNWHIGQISDKELEKTGKVYQVN